MALTEINTWFVAPAEPEMVTGGAETEVSAQIAGLDAGQTYYYRLVAFSIGGTAVSGQGVFGPLTEPVSVLVGGAAIAARAQVVGAWMLGERTLPLISIRILKIKHH